MIMTAYLLSRAVRFTCAVVKSIDQVISIQGFTFRILPISHTPRSGVFFIVVVNIVNFKIIFFHINHKLADAWTLENTNYTRFCNFNKLMNLSSILSLINPNNLVALKKS